MDAREPQAVPVHAPAGYRFPEASEGLLPWSHAEKLLQDARNYWIATVRPAGCPHVTPVWGAWVGRALYFDGSPTTRWARNIAMNSAAEFAL